MATITATHLDAPTDRSGRRHRALAANGVRAVRQAAQAVSAARHRIHRSPVLTAAGLTSGTASAWTTFGLGAGLAALAAAFFVFDWSLD